MTTSVSQRRRRLRPTPKTLVEVLFCLGLLSVAGGAQALTFGPVRVLSGAGQPLELEVELLDVDEPPVAVRALPTSKERDLQFDKKLDFDVETKIVRLPDGRHVLRLTSRQLIQQPELQFALEVDDGEGVLARDFSVALAQPAPATPIATPAPARLAADRPAPVPAPAPVAAVAAPDASHGVSVPRAAPAAIAVPAAPAPASAAARPVAPVPVSEAVVAAPASPVSPTAATPAPKSERIRQPISISSVAAGEFSASAVAPGATQPPAPSTAAPRARSSEAQDLLQPPRLGPADGAETTAATVPTRRERMPLPRRGDRSRERQAGIVATPATTQPAPVAPIAPITAPAPEAPAVRLEAAQPETPAVAEQVSAVRPAQRVRRAVRKSRAPVRKAPARELAPAVEPPAPAPQRDPTPPPIALAPADATPAVEPEAPSTALVPPSGSLPSASSTGSDAIDAAAPAEALPPAVADTGQALAPQAPATETPSADVDTQAPEQDSAALPAPEASAADTGATVEPEDAAEVPAPEQGDEHAPAAVEEAIAEAADEPASPPVVRAPGQEQAKADAQERGLPWLSIALGALALILLGVLMTWRRRRRERLQKGRIDLDALRALHAEDGSTDDGWIQQAGRPSDEAPMQPEAQDDEPPVAAGEDAVHAVGVPEHGAERIGSGSSGVPGDNQQLPVDGEIEVEEAVNELDDVAARLAEAQSLLAQGRNQEAGASAQEIVDLCNVLEAELAELARRHPSE